MTLPGFNMDTFEAARPIFSDRMSVSKLGITQVQALITRLEVYRESMQQVLSAWNRINSDHYKICKWDVLLKLKEPIQLMTYSSEMLVNLIEAVTRDINAYNKQLLKLEEEYKEKSNG